MGLFQKAVETYDCMQRVFASGGKGNTVYDEGRTALAPVSHLITRADIEITIDAEGCFVTASVVDKNEPKIIIPVTESSAGRSSNISAHPLDEQLGYLIPDNQNKYDAYVTQLADWVHSDESHPKLAAVLTYVQKGTILSDLERAAVLPAAEKRKLQDEKKLVRWRVHGAGDPDACWEDASLFQCFIAYYQKLHQEDEKDYCFITGDYTRQAQQHPKGVVAVHGNAKLISANDTRGFTYLGRFAEKNQAATIGYEASQKAHNALRWLVSNEGVSVVYGGRTFLCWNPQGRMVPSMVGPFSFGTPKVEPTHYKPYLKKALEGHRCELPAYESVVIAAFDAATSGRLSVTYYNELLASDFLERLHHWYEWCCWKRLTGDLQSPSLWQIVQCTFGTEQSDGRLKTDDRVLRQQMQRLIACRIDRASIPADIVKKLHQRASMPQAYSEVNRENVLFIACAVIRKYRFDLLKEEWEMALEKDRQDRSYQLGRLLAVYEKVEQAALRKINEERETNAIRMQAAFCQRPMVVAADLEKKLSQAYFPRLSRGSEIFYRNLISEIMEKIGAFPEEEWGKPLKETYLMGYYLQRQAFNEKNNKTEVEENEQFAE